MSHNLWGRSGTLIFIKDTDILLSGDKCTVVVNVALDDYVTLVDSVRLVLGHIRQNILTYSLHGAEFFLSS